MFLCTVGAMSNTDKRLPGCEIYAHQGTGGDAGAKASRTWPCTSANAQASYDDWRRVVHGQVRDASAAMDTAVM